jgi:hypothetical protein
MDGFHYANDLLQENECFAISIVCKYENVLLHVSVQPNAPKNLIFASPICL